MEPPIRKSSVRLSSRYLLLGVLRGVSFFSLSPLVRPKDFVKSNLIYWVIV